MKPKKIAALMEEITIDEARVLLESLPETAQKAVLEALSPERLAVIVSQAKSEKPETTNTSTTSSKESL
jgi:Mg/Co/Ni transporter MgtE